MKTIPCSYCPKGQCYAQHDGDGAMELKCLQCSRVKRKANGAPFRLQIAEAIHLGVNREDALAIVFADWSAFLWSDHPAALNGLLRDDDAA